MITAAYRTVTGDPVDELNQIKDELRVVWLALSSPHADQGYTPHIGEHVNGIVNRLEALCEAMSGPVRMTGGERNG